MTEQELLRALRARGPLTEPADATPADDPDQSIPADTTSAATGEPVNAAEDAADADTTGSSEGTGVAEEPTKGSALASKTKRTGRHSHRNRMKITDSSWDQAFLISYLPQFAKARRESYFEEEIDRVGNYVAVHGDQSQVMKMLVDASKVEAWAMMNSAQASALVPHISFTKIATPALMELSPDTPQEVPISFDAGLSLEAIMNRGSVQGAASTGGAGIKDVKVLRKWGKTGPMTKPRITVSVTFGFDSMETFTKNQRSGISYLDLIPTASAKLKTSGKRDTLWDLRMTYGWEEPIDSHGAVFGGPAGQRILTEVGKTKVTLNLMYGGKHDIAIQDDGSVELSIEYLTSSEAAQGDEPDARSDILGYMTQASFVKDYEDSRQLLLDQLDGMASQRDTAQENFAETERKMKDAEREVEEFFRNEAASKKDEALGVTADLADELGVTVSELRNMVSGGSAMDQSVKGFIADIEILADDPAGAPEPYDPEKYAVYLKSHEEKQSKLKSARTEHQTALENFRQELMQKQKEVSDIHAKLRTLDETHQRMKEKKYSSLVEALHRSERLYALDLSPTDISKHSGRNRGRAANGYKKFRDEKIMDMLTEGVNNTDQIADLPSEQDQVNDYIRDLWEKLMGGSLGQASAAARNPVSAKAKKGIKNQDVRTKRVYYFYLGDLLDIVMTNYYGHAMSDIGGDDPSQWGSRFQRISLMLGDFNYNTYKNDTKPRSKPEEHIRSEAIHMGDFPISLSSFLSWFSERFVKIGYPTISLEHFLSELANTFFGQPVFTDVPKNSWGPMLNPHLPKQSWDMMFNELTTSFKLERGFDQRINIGEFYDVENHPKFKEEALLPMPNTGRSYTYLTVGPGFENNMSEPAFSIFMGSQTSFIKSVKYNKSGGNKRSRTTRIMNNGGGQGNIKFGPASTYTVDIELLGSPFFLPGLCFELNNNVFGMSTLTSEGESLTDILPRILNVNEVEHKLSPNTFETSIKCRPAGISIRTFVDSKGETKGTFGLLRPGVRKK